MASLKELRQRIRSVKNTQQITKTMKMVSAAKVRKAREACESARPFAERLGAVLADLAKTVHKAGASPLLAGRESEKTVRLVVFGSDRGLCGGFNGQMFKEAVRQIESLRGAGKTVQITTVGRKPKESLRGLYGGLIVSTYDNFATGGISYEQAEEIGTALRNDFEKGTCDRVIILYNRFESMMRQPATVAQLIPFAPEGGEEPEGPSAGVEYEPEDGIIMAELLPYNINMQIFRALLESNASEQAARMMAMENATKNAGDMIKSLSLTYNRTRQAAITKELIEIISGAEAI